MILSLSSPCAAAAVGVRDAGAYNRESGQPSRPREVWGRTCCPPAITLPLDTARSCFEEPDSVSNAECKVAVDDVVPRSRRNLAPETGVKLFLAHSKSLFIEY